MTPEQLSSTVRAVVAALVTDGAMTLSGALDEELPEVRIERPKVPEHGDYASNVALQLAKRAGMPPRALAELLADRLAKEPGVGSVEVAGPGFMNIRVEAAALGEMARAAVLTGAQFGHASAADPLEINLEFISANPTGPLHLGHTRWAAVGDAMGRVLSAAGHRVTREFYINDRGVQMDKFGASLMARANGREPDEDGYLGDYIGQLAARVVADVPHILDLPEPEQIAAFREAGYRLQLDDQRTQLDRFRTHFDVWYSERSLHADGRVAHGLARLKEQGHVYEADGAVWMSTTDFGDDKDRVLVKADGELTYFAADTAYYVDKRERGFDRCIYLLGADHSGYVARLAALAACAGDDPSQTIDVIIGQMVKILRNGAELKLSKRAGTMVTLGELVEEIGVDALRYTLCRYPVDSPLTADVAEMTRAAMDNPVYYVQYAHARLSSILRNAKDLGVAVADAGEQAVTPFDPGLLDHPREGDLLRALGEFPRIVATAAELREPHRVARYLEELASTFSRFYDVCRVLPRGDEEPTSLHSARLLLVAATRVVIANGLELLGVSAPERM